MSQVNVLMLGGRRAGKTCLAASMMRDLQYLEVETNVECLLINGYDTWFEEKIKELSYCFEDPWFHDKNVFEMYYSNCGQMVETWEYELHHLKLHKNIGTLKIADIDGTVLGIGTAFLDGFLDDNMETLEQTQVFLIAIDTPHLMEDADPATGIGRSHQWFNRAEEVTRVIKLALERKQKKSLVIFAPVKCEKYYYAGRMEKVNRAVHAGYRELLEYLTCGPAKDWCTTAITPVLTIGGVSFLYFRDGDSRGTGLYHFRLGSERMYSPRYCEQPILLILLRLLDETEAEIRALNPFAKVW